MKKKRILAALLAGVMVISAGCGASGSGGEGTSDSSDSGEVTITIPSYKTGENVGAVFFEPQVERFNEAYEGQYHIELENVTEDVFIDQMKQLAQQDALPALVQGGDKEWLRTVVFPNGMAYDISGWLDEHPEIKELMLDDAIEYCTEDDGAIYSVPLATVRPTGFFYNSALWDTTEELEAYLLAEGGDAPNLEYSEEFVAQQGETQVLADLAADTTEDTVYAPCILDVIPSSVASSDLSRLLPSLADGTYTAEEFCQQLTTAAQEATAE